MAQYDADVIVIGGGPGGYPAAITAAKLGGKVVCIDFDAAGGTCLNWGCIPTKTMIGSVAALEQAKHGADFGLKISGEVEYDFGALMARKDKVVKTLVSPIPGLADGGADSDVFITNAEARKRRAEGKLANTTVWTSNEAVSSLDVPKRLAVIGGGVIGCEFAYTYRGLGSEVTVLEFLPRILPPFEEEISSELQKLLTKAGIKFMTSTKVVGVDVAGKKLKYTSEKGDGELEFDKILVAVGRRAFVDNVDLGAAGVTFDGKAIPTDDYLHTNVPHIYAIGDVAAHDQPFHGTYAGGLAHVATREGEVAAGNAMGHDEKMDWRAIPNCVYTEPEIAATGLTEQEARDKGYDVKVGKFTFKSLGKAMAINENVGLVKIVTDAKYGEILGVHIVGPHATDLIHEACVSIKLESTIDELMHTIHAHPTLSEAIMEAAQDVAGLSVHK